MNGPGRRAGPVLTRRQLNRALLDRQLLLARAHLSAADALGHLVGMQAQAPLAPYVGLWSRLDGFVPDELAAMMRERRAVRTHLMRATIHLVTAEDCMVLRPLMQSVAARGYAGSPFARDLAGADTEAVVAAGRQLLDEAPRGRVELGRVLGERGPDRDAGSLAATVTYLVPSVQVTPRGVWGETGPVAWSTIESWLGRPLPAEAAAPDEVVLRYLAAFGPATTADMRAWSGLTGLGEVTERVRPRLRTFRDDEGRELFDVAYGSIPDPGTPAPPRFLPEYDNVLLSHADRTRVNDQARDIPLPPGNGATRGTFLVDGFYRGTWKIVRSAGRATLHVRAFSALGQRDVDELSAEGRRLLAFAAGGAAVQDVEIGSG